MTPEPVCCTPEMTILEASRLMAQHHIGAIPVVTSSEGKFLIGIITDRDLVCRGVAHDRDADDTTVRDCMSSPVAAVTANTTIEACASIMEADQVRRIPVVNDHRQVEGIVAQSDIARTASAEVVADLLRDLSEPTETASRVPLAA
jgi:CBS domain-containing protein